MESSVLPGSFAHPVVFFYGGMVGGAIILCLAKGDLRLRVAGMGLMPMLVTFFADGLMDLSVDTYAKFIIAETCIAVAVLSTIALRYGTNWSIFAAAFAFNALLVATPIALRVVPNVQGVLLLNAMLTFWELLTAGALIAGVVESQRGAGEGGSPGRQKV